MWCAQTVHRYMLYFISHSTVEFDYPPVCWLHCEEEIHEAITTSPCSTYTVLAFEANCLAIIW